MGSPALLAVHGADVTVDWWAWLAFLAFLISMLTLDLVLLQRRVRVPSFRRALAWTSFWVALGVSFGALLLVWLGAEQAGEYYAGYVLEWSLSVDNVLVFALIFSYFAVPIETQRRVLFWGIVGALAFRGTFIVAGAELLERVSWTKYTLGAFLVVAACALLIRRNQRVDPERNPVVRLGRAVLPLTSEYRGDRFFVREPGLLATPLVLALIAVETTDAVFALDSIPAILAVTTNAFVIFTANAFAVLGLRSLYFCAAGAIDRFEYLPAGLAAVLVFVGMKLVLSNLVGEVPIEISLAVIAALLGGAVVASLLTGPPRSTVRLHPLRRMRAFLGL